MKTVQGGTKKIPIINSGLTSDALTSAINDRLRRASGLQTKGKLKPGNALTIDATGDIVDAGPFAPLDSTPNFADNETPSGSLNGSNQTFTLAHTPSPAGSLVLVLNGVVLLQGTDYTLSTATITLTNATPNSSNNEWLKAWYRH